MKWLPVSVVLLATLASGAQLRPLRLEYRVEPASVACPDEATFRSAMAARLGVDPFEDGARASLQVIIQPSTAGHRAEIALIDEAGAKKTRQLSGTRTDCADLGEALALSLSVAVEAFTASPPAVVAPAPLPPLPAPPPPAPTPVTPVLPFAPLGGGVALGMAPSPAGVLWVGGGVQRRSLSLALEGRFQFPAGIAVEGGRVDVASLSLELVPCVELRPLRVCALLSGGALRSWATHLEAARESVTPLAGLGGRLEISVPLFWRLFFSGIAEVRGALAQTALRVGAREVWVTPPVGGVVGIALTARWNVTDSP